MPTPSEKAQAAIAVIRTVIDAIELSPEGVPGGTIYAALSANGTSLQQYEQVMGICVESGRVRKVGHLYLPAEVIRK